MAVQIEWDDAKAQLNRQKHGVSFEQARSLLESSGDYLEIFDSEHSVVDDRFIAIGPISGGVVVVVYTEREEETIRIIGARWANKRERSLYRSYMDGYR